MPQRWWIPASGAVVLIGAVFVFAGPLVLDPVFNRFERLPDGPVRSQVLELARRADVRVGEVYVVDASKRTTAANAYVTGLGSSKRVVLYDTLLRDFPGEETRLVVAHELAHVHHRDVPNALLFLALVAPAGMFAVSRLTRAWGPGDGLPAGPSSVPALFASMALVVVLVGVVSNQLSRRVEARADSYALQLTGDAPTFLAQQRRLALRNVSDPDPPALARALLGTHPTTRERLGIGLAYERGARD
jgi:STE24 endopeptidase